MRISNSSTFHQESSVSNQNDNVVRGYLLIPNFWCNRASFLLKFSSKQIKETNISETFDRHYNLLFEIVFNKVNIETFNIYNKVRFHFPRKNRMISSNSKASQQVAMQLFLTAFKKKPSNI